MVNFHVTNDIFRLIRKDEKTHEYREYKEYWIKRLDGINPPLMANIIPGYTRNKLPITITKIEIINSSDIVNPYYRSFIKTKQCFDIEFKNG